MRVKCHPTLGILVCTDGHVMVPQNYRSPAHWTFGCKNSKGYLCVMVNGKKYTVHRLVAETFIPNPENKPFIDHLNRNREDNRVSPVCNLRWTTHSENNRNTSSHDRVDARGGTHWYEDRGQYYREKASIYYKSHGDSHKFHRYVLFSDGKRRWIPNSEAALLQAIPVKERTWPR